MTETEKAIQAFEISSENPMHEGCAMPYYAVVEPAFETALEALREKAEREKGCEACGLIYKLDGAAYGTVDELVDNTFCPMCGKRLEVHHEAD